MYFCNFLWDFDELQSISSHQKLHICEVVRIIEQIQCTPVNFYGILMNWSPISISSHRKFHICEVKQSIELHMPTYK